MESPTSENYAAFLDRLFHQIASPDFSDPQAEDIFVPPPYTYYEEWDDAVLRMELRSMGKEMGGDTSRTQLQAAYRLRKYDVEKWSETWLRANLGEVGIVPPPETPMEQMQRMYVEAAYKVDEWDEVKLRTELKKLGIELNWDTPLASCQVIFQQQASGTVLWASCGRPLFCETRAPCACRWVWGGVASCAPSSAPSFNTVLRIAIRTVARTTSDPLDTQHSR